MASDKGKEIKATVKKDSTEHLFPVSQPKQQTLDVSREGAKRVKRPQSRFMERQSPARQSLQKNIRDYNIRDKVYMDRDDEIIAMHKNGDMKGIIQSHQSFVSRALGGDNSQSPFLHYVWANERYDEICDKYKGMSESARTRVTERVDSQYRDAINVEEDKWKKYDKTYQELLAVDPGEKGIGDKIKNAKDYLDMLDKRIANLKNERKSDIKEQLDEQSAIDKASMDAELAGLKTEYERRIKASDGGDPWKLTKLVPKFVLRAGGGFL